MNANKVNGGRGGRKERKQCNQLAKKRKGVWKLKLKGSSKTRSFRQTYNEGDSRHRGKEAVQSGAWTSSTTLSDLFQRTSPDNVIIHPGLGRI